ncbi:PepSY domain-containing protein [bacterium]|nr:PepSY domain-containing protein [bacterium]
MKYKGLAVLASLAILGFCGISCSATNADDPGSMIIREEATRRNVTIISVDQAKSAVAQRLSSKKVRYGDIKLENEADDYPNESNFRPVYKIECITGLWTEYEFEIDAVSGEMLKVEADD